MLPPFPAQLDYLWRHYCQHTLGMAASGMAPARVTWDGLMAWCRLMKLKLDPEEVLVLVRMGHESAVAQAEEINKASKRDVVVHKNRSRR